MANKRGRPKKILEGVEIDVEEAEVNTPEEVQISDAETASVKRIADLRNLYQTLLTEGIHSISEVEVKIQQEETNLANIRNKK